MTELWWEGEELRGIAQEELTDDRLRFGVPHLLVLKPVEGAASP